VDVGVAVLVLVGVTVAVGLGVCVLVEVAVAVAVGVIVALAVNVRLGPVDGVRVGVAVCVAVLVGGGVGSVVEHVPLSSDPMSPSPLVSAASMQKLKPVQAACVNLPNEARHRKRLLILQVTLLNAPCLMHGTMSLPAGWPQVEFV
jgi:hypothetical protein